MSYILEALRRAERERTQNGTPDLTLNPMPPPTQAARPSRYRPLVLGLLCLLLGVALLATMLRPRSAATPPAAAPLAAAEPVVEPATPPVVAMDASDDTTMSLQQQNPATLDDIINDNSADTQAREQALREMVVHRDPEPATAAPNVAAPAVDVAPVAEATPEPAAAPAPPAPPAPTTKVERVQLAAAPAPSIPKLIDMPASYRSAFPSLSMEVHAYDALARKRFVMISGRSYREGDTLSEGPKIVQIVPEGVIFDFHGERTLYSIQRP